MKRIWGILVMTLTLSWSSLCCQAQAVPVPLTETGLYDFLDELITDGVISHQTAVRPYMRNQVADMLMEAMAAEPLLSKRQRQDLLFYMEDFALELDTLPDYSFYGIDNKAQYRRLTGQSLGKDGSKPARADFNLSLVDPAFHLKTADNRFKLAIHPILGMDLDYNKHGLVRHQFVGAEIRMDIAHHLSIWGSLRDHSYYGQRLDEGRYLLNRPGVQYKEATNSSGGHVGDYSDSKGGIAAYSWWGRIAIEREPIRWGDAYHSSNILSGHAPAFPMISMQLTPCSWFQFDYFHAWLVSNMLDTSYFYTETNPLGETIQHYRPYPKYMAANMFTFKPVKQLSFSFGNSIVYAENNLQAAYFIPIAFFKSLDHLLTKGVHSENQNSQVFASVSVRPVEHLQLYGTFYIDEVSFSRLKKDNPQHNPISYLVGFNWSGWPVKGLSLKGEFMRTNIACYTHSVGQLTYASNSYNMGHYMGDNAQSVYLSLAYRPTRGLRLWLDYTCDTKYNSYAYLRGNSLSGQRLYEGGIGETISQTPFRDRIWQNDVIGFHAQYEVFQNCHAHVDLTYNNARGFAPEPGHLCLDQKGGNYGKWVNTACASEDRGGGLEADALAAYYLNRFSPAFYQGQNISFSCGLSFNF